MESFNPIAFLGLGFTVDPNPVAFTLFGRGIYWYGIIIAIGFALGIVYAMYRAKQENINTDHLLDVVLFTAPLAFICARIYYVIFNLGEYDTFFEMIAIWEGGIAIYGGVIGAFLFGALFAKWKKIPIFKTADIAALSFMIGQFIGRWGNFINREAHGGITNMPWGMEITIDGIRTTVHPTFFYESLWNFIGFLILNKYYKHKKFDGEIFLLYVIWYGVGRFFIEGMRTDSLYFFATGLRVSQVLAGVSALAALALIGYVRRVKAVALVSEPERSTRIYTKPTKAPDAKEAQVDMSQTMKIAKLIADQNEIIDSQTEIIEEKNQDEHKD